MAQGAEVLRKGRGSLGPHTVRSMSKGYQVKMPRGGRSSCTGEHKGESKYGHRGPKMGQIQRKVSSFAQHKDTNASH